MKNKKVPIFCSVETLRQMVVSSVGSKMFRSSYFFSGEKIKDFCRGGKLSCVFYVSFLLSAFGLIKGLHLTVDGLEKDLSESGWFSVPISPFISLCSVVIWKKRKGFNGKEHRHAGFYIGRESCCVSTKNGVPAEHDMYCDEKREIDRIFAHPALAAQFLSLINS